ncbi:MAG: DoxX family protein [Actinomycetota bacterium]
MNIVAWIVGLLLAGGFFAAGGAKVRSLEPMVASRDRLGVSPGLFTAIGGLEILGAVGLIIGLTGDGNVEWIGTLAALGLIIVTAGAIVYHRRAADPPQESVPAVAMLVLSVLYIVLLAVR